MFMYTGRPRSAEVNERVVEFYLRDDISSPLPGKKDYLSLKNEKTGVREHVQKRLMLSNVKETFVLFKKEHPDLKVGWTSFALLRPKQCVLAGTGGTHSVCVCPIHENVKLAINGKIMLLLLFLTLRDFIFY